MDVDQRDEWKIKILMVEHAYNNSIQSPRNKTTFEIIEGETKLSLIVMHIDNVFVVYEHSRNFKKFFDKMKEAISIV